MMENIATTTTDTITIIETNLDDANGERLGYLMSKLHEDGALDVSYTSIQMKKNRPGVKLTILAKNDKINKLVDTLFKESNTLGVRITEASRLKCERSFEQVNTEYGPIKIKIASWQGNIVNVKPEYEDCKAIALNHNMALKKVQDLALRIYRNKTES